MSSWKTSGSLSDKAYKCGINNISNTIGDAYIKIHTNFNIPDSVGVWGYGNYGGTAYVYDGYIEMQSSGSLSSSEYMTILVQFPSNTFNCSNKLNYDFNHYYNMAEEGAEHYSKDSSNFFNVISTFFIATIPTVLIIVLILYAIFSTAKTGSLNFGKVGKKLPKNVDYFRDIPCNNDLHRAYFIAYNYGILIRK